MSHATTISWEPADKRDNVMWRAPRDIVNNDNVVVREDEIALFLRDGKLLLKIDIPDRYALTSTNAAIVGPLVKWLTGAQQKAEVYYFQRRLFDGRFGTAQPLVYHDTRFGMVQLRAFGEFRFRIEDPTKFVTEFAGSMHSITGTAVETRVRERVLMVLSTILGEQKARGLSVLEIPQNLLGFEQLVLARVASHFETLGIKVTELSGLSITLPPSVQAAVDDFSKASMFDGASLQKLQAYEASKAIGLAASNAGGAAGIGAQAALGAAVGAAAADAMRPEPHRTIVPSSPQSGRNCGNCARPVPSGARFCPECGSKVAQKAFCSNCGTESQAGSKFCGNCGTRAEAV